MENGVDEGLQDRGERRLGDLRGNGGNGLDAGRADGGVRVTEAAEDGGEHLGEVRRQSIAVSGGEHPNEADGMAANRGLVGRISGGEAGEKRGKSIIRQPPRNGLKLIRRRRECIPVRQPVQACDHPALEINTQLSRQRHFLFNVNTLAN